MWLLHGILLQIWSIYALCVALGDLGMAWVSITTMSLALAVGLNTLVGKVERQARYDSLTGLLGRDGLSDYRELHPRAGRTQLPRSPVVIDIDGFTVVNDAGGGRDSVVVRDRRLAPR